MENTSIYYAIIYPLSGRWTKTRGRLVVFLIWFFSIALSSFQLVHGKAEKFEIGGQEVYDCNEIWGEVEGKVYTLVVFSVTFVFPILILSYAYGSIGIKMWGHTLPGNADPSRDRQQLAAKMKVVKMMAIVVALFVISWLPIQIFGLLVYFAPDYVLPSEDEYFPGFAAAFLCCHWLSMANSFVNPLVYCFMSDNFRTDLRQLLWCNRRRVRLDAHASTMMTGSSNIKGSHIPLRSLRPSEKKILKRSCSEKTWSSSNQEKAAISA
ncbi:RYamide receptor [Nephila pilipes]|uniref:RYamide receptor n=1 Tax=Nephila pilipes TaxID=299642 RepID=A0A8X6M9Z0_NEPPI|nr:RYamide receptor [Nephila pilipes]